MSDDSGTPVTEKRAKEDPHGQAFLARLCCWGPWRVHSDGADVVTETVSSSGRAATKPPRAEDPADSKALPAAKKPSAEFPAAPGRPDKDAAEDSTPQRTNSDVTEDGKSRRAVVAVHPGPSVADIKRLRSVRDPNAAGALGPNRSYRARVRSLRKVMSAAPAALHSLSQKGDPPLLARSGTVAVGTKSRLSQHAESGNGDAPPAKAAGIMSAPELERAETEGSGAGNGVLSGAAVGQVADDAVEREDTDPAKGAAGRRMEAGGGAESEGGAAEAEAARGGVASTSSAPRASVDGAGAARVDSRGISEDANGGGDGASEHASGGSGVGLAMGARTGVPPQPPVPLMLSVIGGPSDGTSKTLRPVPGQEYRIGRKGFCDIMINDHEVSSEHASVTYDADLPGWVIRDLGSLNGTKLNGLSIWNVAEARHQGERYPLQDGDMITLAESTEIEVQLGDEEDDALNDSFSPSSAKRSMFGRGKLLRKVNQGATMRASVPDDQGPWLPILDTARRTDVRVTERRESGTSTFIAASTLGVFTACSVNVGLKHVKEGLPSEDNVFVALPAAEAPAALCGAFGLMDGHKGGKASTLAKGMFVHAIREFLVSAGGVSPGPQGFREQIHKAFLWIDSQLTQRCLEGCTATVVLCWQENGATWVQTANVGDSEALLVSFETHERRLLTACHRVSDEAENTRLRNMGVEVVPGQLRLDGLQLARCLGDREFKEVYPGAIIAEPHVSEPVEIGGEGAVIVVGSDGLWDGLSKERCAELVMEVLEDSGGGLSGADQLSAARDILVEESVEGGSKDDISIHVIRLLPAGKILGNNTSSHSMASSSSFNQRVSQPCSESGQQGGLLSIEKEEGGHAGTHAE